jgi:hypothetical protein
MSTAKVSVAIGEEELEWARSLARQEGKSLSAVLTESLAERRRLAALREVVAWMGNGAAPLSKEELATANVELGGASRARASRGSRKPPPRRR